MKDISKLTTLKIGITGGIGSGKTTVCDIFRTIGIPIYNADIEAKKLYDSDPILKQKLIYFFGIEIYPNNIFDKKALANIVFSDVEKLKKLNQLVHPLILKQGDDWFSKQTSMYAIKEAALLIESESYHQLDKIILVTAPENIRLQRVATRDSTSPEMVLERMNKQYSDQSKRRFVHFEIVNDNEQLLIPQVIKIHEQLLYLASQK